MDLAQIFADLDAQPWADREHAYGSAEDVPDQRPSTASTSTSLRLATHRTGRPGLIREDPPDRP